MIVGMSAALVQGARGATEDIDLWFEHIGDVRIGEAVRRVDGGVWVTRTQPPMLGGGELGERWDVVTTMSGLPDFAKEYESAKHFVIDGVTVPVLPLERIVASKKAANRPKDQAVLYALESALKVIASVDAAPSQEAPVISPLESPNLDLGKDRG